MGKKFITLQDSFSPNLKEANIISFDIQSDDGKTLPLMHKHSRFLYILEGAGKIKIQDRVYHIAPGTVISILPWQTSEIIKVDKKLSYYLLVYNFNLVSVYIKGQMNLNNEDVNFINFLYSKESAIYDTKTCDKIESIFKDIKEEVGVSSLNIMKKNEKRFSTIYLLSKITELIILYFRAIDDKDNYDSSLATEPKNIFMYMFLNSSSEISLEVLSKIFLMSESAISQYIKDVTGLGFLDILHEIRVYKAKFLLLHTKMTLKEIADAVNYSDPAQLSKVFLNKQSLSTKDFKKLNTLVEGKPTTSFDPKDLSMIDYVNENFSKKIDILDLANTFDTSPRNINKIFIYFLEQNFYTYLNKRRVHEACKLLVNTTDSITEIALAVGYNSSKTLLRNFIKHAGMAPSEFRESYKADC